MNEANEEVMMTNEPVRYGQVQRHMTPQAWVKIAAVAVLFVAIDAVALGAWSADRHSGLSGPVIVGRLPSHATAAAAARVADSEPGPPPVSLVIPRISVNSALDDLRLGTDGAIRVPMHADRAGWWSQGARPGDAGTAVIVGHVDSYDGAGVFVRLQQLRPGDEVFVHRNDGTEARFVVDALRQFAKKSFPSDAVYGATPQSQLRLITCSGRFDRRTRHYLNNLVVFAHLVDRKGTTS